MTCPAKWAVENEGVPPDIEVEYTPAEVIKGRDPQLERAVQEGEASGTEPRAACATAGADDREYREPDKSYNPLVG